MPTQTITFDTSGHDKWAGMGDFIMVSPDGSYQVECRYHTEPPHGDSIHVVSLRGDRLPGFVWGRYFAFSPCSRYFACSWMDRLFGATRTLVIDLAELSYWVADNDLYRFSLVWPRLDAVAGSFAEGHRFDGTEQWLLMRPEPG